MKIPSLFCGNKCIFIIDNFRNVYSIGSNSCLQLGNDENIISHIPNKIQSLTDIKIVECGDNHAMFLDFTGDVFGVGYNTYGQLGIGNPIKSIFIPRKLSVSDINNIVCGPRYTLFVCKNGFVYSCGENQDKQLGHKDSCNYLFPIKINGLYNVELIACGESHVICKTSNNTCYSWGNGLYGKLGSGNICNEPLTSTVTRNWPEDIVSIHCGLNHSLLLTHNGDVYGFGCNNYGQIACDKDEKYSPTLIKNIPKIQRIECGNNHSLCIDIDEKLWIFGDNEYGQLGFDKTDCTTSNKPLIHEKLGYIYDISKGGNNTIIRTSIGDIYGWGDCSSGQIKRINKESKIITTPIRILEDNEELWALSHGSSKQKSARK